MELLMTPLVAGVIGGGLGYRLLRRIAGDSHDERESTAYANVSKLEALFGPDIWSLIEGRQIIDVGCGKGVEAVEAACHGARRVIGMDIRETMLTSARRRARAAGVGDRCVFATEVTEEADLVVSIDGFEHYEDPAAMLSLMRRLVRPDGRVLIAFGPPWFHPLGGHLFSIFPWAHLVFTERAFIRWRSHFKFDGATRFSETEGGLNRMTIRRFRQLVRAADFEVEALEMLPIRRLSWLSNPLTREFVTTVVRCRLVPGRQPLSAQPLAEAV